MNTPRGTTGDGYPDWMSADLRNRLDADRAEREKAARGPSRITRVTKAVALAVAVVAAAAYGVKALAERPTGSHDADVVHNVMNGENPFHTPQDDDQADDRQPTLDDLDSAVDNQQ